MPAPVAEVPVCDPALEWPQRLPGHQAGALECALAPALLRRGEITERGHALGFVLQIAGDEFRHLLFRHLPYGEAACAGQIALGHVEQVVQLVRRCAGQAALQPRGVFRERVRYGAVVHHQHGAVVPAAHQLHVVEHHLCIRQRGDTAQAVADRMAQQGDCGIHHQCGGQECHHFKTACAQQVHMLLVCARLQADVVIKWQRLEPILCRQPLAATYQQRYAQIKKSRRPAGQRGPPGKP